MVYFLIGVAAFIFGCISTVLFFAYGLGSWLREKKKGNVIITYADSSKPEVYAQFTDSPSNFKNMTYIVLEVHNFESREKHGI